MTVLLLFRCKKSKLVSNSILGGFVLGVAQEIYVEVDNPLARAMNNGVAGAGSKDK